MGWTGGLGVVDETVTFAVDGQWDPAVLHGNYIQSLVMQQVEGKLRERMCVYDWVTLLCGRNGQNTVNQP